MRELEVQRQGGFQIGKGFCHQRNTVVAGLRQAFEFEFGNQGMSLSVLSDRCCRVHSDQCLRVRRGGTGCPVLSGTHAIRLTPGPGSPVAQTCDGGAVNEHGRQCSKGPGGANRNFGTHSKTLLRVLLCRIKMESERPYYFKETSMKSLKQWAAGAVLCLLAAGAMAQVNVSGVRYDESVDAARHQAAAQRRGRALSRPCSRCTPRACTSAKKAGKRTEEALAAPGPKRTQHRRCLRDIDSGELGKLFSRAHRGQHGQGRVSPSWSPACCA
jgi:hypothetical protein